MCSSNDVILGNVVWIYAAIRSLPDRTNRVPPFPPPPILRDTNLLASSDEYSAVEMLRLSHEARPLPPSPLVAPTDGIIALPPPPSRPPGSGTNSNVDLLPPRLTNQLDLTEEQVGFFRDGFGLMQFIDTNSVISLTAHIRQVDSDNDGVPDSRDHCPDTLPNSVIDRNGCSIEQLAPCEGNWKNHGAFLNAFKAVTAEFLRCGLINILQARQLNYLAAQSDCGK